MSRSSLRAIFAASVVAAACTQGTLATSVTPLTALQADPAEFLSGVTCGPGGMRRYVATIYDVSRFMGLANRDGLLTSREECYPATQCFVLPSAAPASCFQPVLFQRIVTGRQYVVDIDGYDTEDIQPLAPGSRVMISTGGDAGPAGTVVAPRWKTSCGRRLAENDPGPVPRGGNESIDAGTRDGGRPDAGIVDSGIPELPTHREAGTWYYECRAPRVPVDSGELPYLDGPVCALEFETETFKGCGPLREVTPGRN